MCIRDSVLFVALIGALTLPQSPNELARRRVAAFLFGLGLGNHLSLIFLGPWLFLGFGAKLPPLTAARRLFGLLLPCLAGLAVYVYLPPVSYTHLRAHETVLDLVCRLLLEKKNFDKRLVTHTSTTT